MKTLLRLLLPCTLLTLANASDPASSILHFDSPASKWENQGLPLGNGSLGAVVFGGTDNARIQFTVDSLWTGDENPSGAYRDKEKNPGTGAFGSFQNFGELIFRHDGTSQDQVKVSIPEDNQHFKTFKAPQSGQSIAESIDGKPATKWCLEHGGRPVVWQVEFTKPRQLTAYAFTSGNDVPGRDPSTWKLEGSQDGKSWQTVDRHQNVPPMKKRGATTRYKLTKPATHRFFRFIFSPRPGVSHFQIADIAFDGIRLESSAPVADAYRRQLDIQRAVHTTTWKQNGVTFTRETINSHPDEVLAWRLSADKPGAISGMLTLKGAHPESEKIDLAGNAIRLHGKFANGLRYEARTTVVAQGGKVTKTKNGLRLTGCDEALILLAADTNYVMDRAAKWMRGDPADKVAPRLAKATRTDWTTLRKRHETDYRTFFDRVSIDLGKTAPDVASLPINKRIQRYRDQAKTLPRPCLDPSLEAMLFQYGRYLLISSSRPGTLPANLQGIWNDKNKPAWFSDYHSNINLQMNYWLAETSNLPELATPLFDMLTAGAPVYRKDTAKEYGKDTQGYVTRMSLNPYGGGGWNWNIEGTAWLSQHFWEHYAFSGDRKFLETTAWPWMRDVSLFWLGRMKKLPDGKLVVPNAWSHEHGPHEDGTAHAQQLMWDLFTHTLIAARTLDMDKPLQQRLEAALGSLYGPKIGSWGQLMEWMEEKPKLEKGNHRHTSHLFAVHPGRQITLTGTPDLAQAAKVSLTKRGEVGDSRRSWTWAWRTALWARLAQADRAHGCVAGLLAYNTLDNLWTTHPPFQIDGNFGITGGMAEIFLQSHAGEISLLPALPAKAWPTGKISGLRARGGVLVDLAWQDGNLTHARLTAPSAQTIRLRLPGATEAQTLKLEANTPYDVQGR